MAEKNFFEQLIRRVADHYDSDVVLYVGPIERPFDDWFISRVKERKHRDNVLLILTTNGGDPHAAYRMARYLQERYETVAGNEGIGPPSDAKVKGKFRLFIDTRCKSAGTILAAGANVLAFSEYGELGLIDAQIRKSDEVGERSSVLTPKYAMESLQNLAIHHFEAAFKEFRFSEEISFTTKLAAEVATDMAVGLFEPIYGQIDPMRVGEYDRAMRIASEYAKRLGRGNLKEGALDKLVEGYPAHGFVIDKKEAEELFKEIEEPTSDLLQLGEITRLWWNPDYLSADRPFIAYLTTPDLYDDDVTEDKPDAANSDEKIYGTSEGGAETPAA